MSTTKEMIKSLEEKIVALEARFNAFTMGEKKTEKKSKKVTPKGSESESETKVKREVKPSAAGEAWRSLCASVRGVYTKDAMKIAKILKEQGHMNPSVAQIEAAQKMLPDDAPAQETVSDSGASGAAKKRGRPKKAASE